MEATQFKTVPDLVSEYVEVAEVELVYAFCATNLSKVFLFGAQDVATEVIWIMP